MNKTFPLECVRSMKCTLASFRGRFGSWHYSGSGRLMGKRPLVVGQMVGFSYGLLRPGAGFLKQASSVSLNCFRVQNDGIHRRLCGSLETL